MCHVLIIEDEPLIALLIQDALEDAGATSFSIAATEEEAVEMACQQRPSVISADVRLIKGTGPKAVEKIQTLMGPLPVMFITGTPEDCAPCEGAIVLTKPVRLHEVQGAFTALAGFGAPH